jgi:hypothetical protein
MVRTTRRSRFGVFAVLVAMALLCVLAGTSAAAAGNTTRVNLDSLGTQATGGGSGTPSISADGRFVAFHSEATNLVPNDTNGKWDVFVRDVQEGTTERVSVISANGRFVAFKSQATNLVPPEASSPGGGISTCATVRRGRPSGSTWPTAARLPGRTVPASALPSAATDASWPSSLGPATWLQAIPTQGPIVATTSSCATGRP